jgi:HK97 gp10 family phage protein
MPRVLVYTTTKKFDNFRRNLGPAMQLGLDEFLGEVVTYAQAFAPVDTGRLRREIHKTSKGVNAPTPYASYQEFGTYKMAAQPFIRPALQAVTPGAARYFGGLGKKMLE